MATVAAGCGVGTGYRLRNSALERECVLAFRQLNHNRIVDPDGDVVLRNLAAQSSDLHPDTRVRLRIEILRPAKELRGNRVLLQMIGRKVQGMVRQVLQQPA